MSSINPIVGIKGAGEMASAAAWRLYHAHFKRIFMMEIAYPQAVRRQVCFSEAVYDGSKTVEGITGIKVECTEDIQKAWINGQIPIIVDPQWKTIGIIKPQVLIDAILAKKNLGTSQNDALLVIGLGPGFSAGQDVHMVIETKRGHNLGRIIPKGCAAPNTGIPGDIGGQTANRVLRSPADGIFYAMLNIGDIVERGQTVGTVNNVEVKANIDGVLRGLIRHGIHVSQGLKIGDIDPRKNIEYCYTISDKARAVSGSVLEAILRDFNIERKLS